MPDKNPQKINALFNDIAPYYDKINNLISFNTHYLIKYLSLKFLDIKVPSEILDICTGTGDFVSLISKYYPKAKITGLDNCENMLKIATAKNPDADFILKDCLETGFEDDKFNYITMAFGLRNIEKRGSVLKEIHRILKPNGQFLHLDFAKHNLFNKIFNLTTSIFIKFLIKHKNHYKYLIESKNEYPEPDILIEEFKQAGFKNFKKKYFLFKTICAIVCEK